MTAQTISQLPVNLDLHNIPQHIAVIMDGNGRWATQRGLPRIAGHRQGTKAIREILKACIDWGISNLTVYAFSRENWGRPHLEVNFLMSLFETVLRQEIETLHSQGICLRLLGELTALPISLQQAIERTIALTANNQKLRFNVALNYGSRQEIAQAFRSLARKVKQDNLTVEAIDEKLIQAYLDTAGIPDPDLLIRTSGKMRLSNFLLWQMAYTEIYITETLWPDFSRVELHSALLEYQRRDRTFGKLSKAK